MADERLGCVYFAVSYRKPMLCKIGHTRQLEKRKRQWSLIEDLKVVYSVPSSPDVEQAIHYLLGEHLAYNNETFWWNEKVKGLVSDLRKLKQDEHSVCFYLFGKIPDYPKAERLLRKIKWMTFDVDGHEIKTACAWGDSLLPDHIHNQTQRELFV